MPRSAKRRRLAVVACVCLAGLAGAVAVFWTDGPGAGRAASSIAVTLENASGVPWEGQTVSMGLPFARGDLDSAEQVRVMDSDGHEVASQVRQLSRWHPFGEAGIRWALVDFGPSVAAGQAPAYHIEYGPGVARQVVTDPARVDESADAITVDTGPLRFVVSKHRASVIEQAWLEGQPVIAVSDGRSGSTMTVLRDSGPTQCWSVGGERPVRTDTLTGPGGRPMPNPLADPKYDYRAAVEERGPLKVSIALHGCHADARGRRFGPYTIRIYAFRGEARLRVTHQWVFSGVPDEERIQEAAVVLPLAFAPGRVVCGADEPVALEGPAASLVQATWNDCQVRGASGATVRAAEHGQGWLGVDDGQRALTVGLHDFWRDHPMSLTLADQRLIIGSHPREAPPLDLRRFEGEVVDNPVPRTGHGQSAQGLAKSREFELLLHAADPGVAAAFGARVQEPLWPRPDGRYVSGTGVLGHFWYDANVYPRSSYGTQVLTRWTHYVRERLHPDDQLGLLNWGDIRGGWLPGMNDFIRPGVVPQTHLDLTQTHWGWSNSSLDAGFGLLVEYLRTGQRWQLRELRAAARHTMDIDLVHYGDGRGRYPMRPEDVGGIHRHGPQHWSNTAYGGYLQNYFATHLYGYYGLTGDETAREALLLSGRNPLSMEAGTGDALAVAYRFELAEEEKALPRLEAWAARLNPVGEFRWGFQDMANLAYCQQVTGSAVLGAALERNFRSACARGEFGNFNGYCLYGLAHTWRLTGDELFRDALAARLADLLRGIRPKPLPDDPADPAVADALAGLARTKVKHADLYAGYHQGYFTANVPFAASALQEAGITEDDVLSRQWAVTDEERGELARDPRVLAQFRPAGGNLVPNPGFENGLARWDLRVDPAAAGSCEAAAEDAHSGTGCLKVTSGGQGRAGVFSAFFPLELDARYEVAFWSKVVSHQGKGWPDHGGLFAYRIEEEPEGRAGQVAFSNRAEGVWKQQRFVIRVTDPSWHFGRVMLNANEAKCTTLFDDVVVRRVERAAAH